MAGGVILVQSLTICWNLELRLRIRLILRSLVSPAIINSNPFLYFVFRMLKASYIWSRSKDFFLEPSLEYKAQHAILCILESFLTFFGVRMHQIASKSQGMFISVFVKFYTSNFFLFTIKAGLPSFSVLYQTFEITTWSSC